MKLPDLTKWELNENTEGLLFFAQALDEMLFHHSLDSFKVPALNVHSNILELLFFAYEFSRGTLRSKNSFSHVIDELIFNLKNDPVIEVGNGSIFAELIRRIKSSDHPRKFFNSAQALHAEFEHEYRNKLYNFILDEVPVNKKKSLILQAIKSFCAEVELRGYSREYIYRATQDFFFSVQEPPKTISKPEQLKEFLDLFSQPPKIYTVFLRANIPVLRYQEHLEEKGIFITNGPGEDIEKLGTAKLIKRKRGGYDGYKTYIKIENNKTSDPHSAREYAESRLRMFFDAYTFLDHKTKIDIYPSCIVVKAGDEPQETFFRARPHPMEKASSRSKVPNNQLQQTFDSLFRSFTSQATHQLFRVFDYHSTAISTDAPESQLISLWAALEGLFPASIKGDRGINYYLKMLLPALVLTYPEKIFLYMTDALKHAGKVPKDIIQKNSKGSNFFEKVVYFIVAEEIGEKANDLTAVLSRYPLLRNRCFWCHTHFNSATAVHKTLEAHRQRLSWHLRRIYLARNQILHNDSTLPYLSTLVENLHSYLDIILKSIIKLGERSVGHTMSISTAFELLGTYESNYLNALKANDSVCQANNFKEILFGRNNPLSPFYKVILKK